MKTQLINDHFQNYKSYQIPKAQLIIADIPYNLGNNAYASNPAWYNDGDNSNGESELAKTLVDSNSLINDEIEKYGFAKTEIIKTYPILF